MKQIKPRLKNNQFGAIWLAKARAEELVKLHPEIADKYRQGKTKAQLAKEYQDITGYDISIGVGKASITFCLESIMEEDELRTIGKQHQVERGEQRAKTITREEQSLAGKIGGKKAYEEGLGAHSLTQKERMEAGSKGGTSTYNKGGGCFAMSEEKRRKASQKGGKIAGLKMGKRNYQAGIGIASLTHEDLVETGKRAAIARGQIPYDSVQKITDRGETTEKLYIIQLKQQTNLSWAQIAEQTNSIFQNNRALESIRTSYNQRWNK